jgi:hypothetical protein
MPFLLKILRKLLREKNRIAHLIKFKAYIENMIKLEYGQTSHYRSVYARRQ